MENSVPFSPLAVRGRASRPAPPVSESRDALPLSPARSRFLSLREKHGFNAQPRQSSSLITAYEQRLKAEQETRKEREREIQKLKDSVSLSQLRCQVVERERNALRLVSPKASPSDETASQMAALIRRSERLQKLVAVSKWKAVLTRMVLRIATNHRNSIFRAFYFWKTQSVAAVPSKKVELLENQIAGERLEFAKMQMKASRLEKVVEELHDSQKNVSSVQDVLETELKKANTEKEALFQQKSALQVELAAAEKTRADQQEKIASLETANEKAAAELKSIREGHSAMKSSTDAELESLRSELAAAKSGKASAEQEVDSLKACVDKLKEDSSLKGDALATELANVRKQLGDSQTALEEKATALELLQSSLADQEKVYSDKIAALESGRAADASELNSLAEKLKAVEESHTAELEILRSELAAAKSGKASAEQEVDSLKASLAQEKEDSSLKRDALATELANVRKQLGDSQTALEEKATALELLQSSLADQEKVYSDKLAALESVRAADASELNSLAEKLKAVEESHTAELEILRSELAAAKSGKASAEQEVDSLKASLVQEKEDSSLKRDALATELANVRKQLGDSQTALEEKATALEMSYGANTGLQSRLADQEMASSKKIAALESKLKAVEENHSAELEILRSELAAAKSGKASAEQEVDSLKASLVQEKEDSSLKGDALATELASVRKQLGDSQTALELARQSNTACSEKIASLESKNSTAATELETLRSELAAAKSGKASAEAEVDNLKACVDKLKGDSSLKGDSLATELANVRKQLSDSQTALELARQSNTACSEKIASLESKNSTAATELETLRSELTAAKSGKASAEAEVDSLKVSLKELKETKSDLDTAMQSNVTDTQTLRTQLESSLAQLKQRESELAGVLEEKSLTEEMEQDLLRQNEALESSLTELRVELKNLRMPETEDEKNSLILELRQKVDALGAEIPAKEGVIQDLQTKLETVTAKDAAKEETIADLKERVADTRAAKDLAIKELEEKVESLTASTIVKTDSEPEEVEESDPENPESDAEAGEPTPLAPAPVVCDGFLKLLTKLGPIDRTIRLYFRAEEGQVSVFKKAHDSVPREAFGVSDSLLLVKPHPSEKFYFELHRPSHPVMCLAAETERFYNEWIDYLRQFVAEHRKSEAAPARARSMSMIPVGTDKRATALSSASLQKLRQEFGDQKLPETEAPPVSEEQDASPPPPPADLATHSGPLFQKTSGVRSKWVEHHFTLDGSRLRRFQDLKSSATPDEVFDISGAVASIVPNSSHEFYFEVELEDMQMLRLCAKTRPEMIDWVNALAAAAGVPAEGLDLIPPPLEKSGSILENLPDDAVGAAEGWLYKKSSGSSLLRRTNWKRRYFVLEGTELSFYASDSPADLAAAHDSIDLAGSDVLLKKNPSYPFYFEIVRANQRPYCLRGGSESDIAAWCAEFKKGGAVVMESDEPPLRGRSLSMTPTRRPSESMMSADDDEDDDEEVTSPPPPMEELKEEEEEEETSSLPDEMLEPMELSPVLDEEEEGVIEEPVATSKPSEVEPVEPVAAVDKPAVEEPPIEFTEEDKKGLAIFGKFVKKKVAAKRSKAAEEKADADSKEPVATSKPAEVVPEPEKADLEIQEPLADPMSPPLSVETAETIEADVEEEEEVEDDTMPPPPPPADSMKHSGFLFKKSTRGVRGHWLERYFVLDGTVLQYFKDDKALLLPADVFDVSGALLSVKRNANHEFYFEVELEDLQILPLYAKTRPEMIDWVNALAAAAGVPAKGRELIPPPLERSGSILENLPDDAVGAAEGWLFKKSSGSSLLRRTNWKRRYFVLEGTELSFYASDSPADLAAAHDSIDLAGSDVLLKKNPSYDNYFEIVRANQRPYCLRADSESDVAAWCAEFKKGGAVVMESDEPPLRGRSLSMTPTRRPSESMISALDDEDDDEEVTSPPPPMEELKEEEEEEETSSLQDQKDSVVVEPKAKSPKPGLVSEGTSSEDSAVPAQPALETAETPAVVKETAVAKEAKVQPVATEPAETPAVVKETAVAKEAKVQPVATEPAETPAVVKETAVAKEAKVQPVATEPAETPAVVKETVASEEIVVTPKPDTKAMDEAGAEGWLYKKSSGSSLLRRTNWKRRYFVLEGTELSYYASAKRQDMQTPRDSIDLAGSDVLLKKNPSYPFYFEIVRANQRPYCLRGGSESDIAAWCAEFKKGGAVVMESDEPPLRGRSLSMTPTRRPSESMMSAEDDDEEVTSPPPPNTPPPIDEEEAPSSLPREPILEEEDQEKEEDVALEDVPPPPPDMPPPQLEDSMKLSGFLFKKSTRGVRSNWLERYFVLDGTVLQYFKDADTPDVKGEFDVSGAIVTIVPNSSHEFYFEVELEDMQVLRLYAKTGSEMMNWVNGVSEASGMPVEGLDNAPLEEGEVDHMSVYSGVLRKKGTGWRSVWKDRYFELNGVYLRYRMEKGAEEIREVFNLSDATLERVVSSTQQFAFAILVDPELNNNREEVTLAAVTETSFTEWRLRLEYICQTRLGSLEDEPSPPPYSSYPLDGLSPIPEAETVTEDDDEEEEEEMPPPPPPLDLEEEGEEEEEGEDYCSGELFQQVKANGDRARRVWKRRRCVLAAGRFSLYDVSGAEQPLAAIDISEAVIRHFSSAKKEWCFDIKVGKSSLRFAALDEIDYDTWLMALDNVSDQPMLGPDSLPSTRFGGATEV